MSFFDKKKAKRTSDFVTLQILRVENHIEIVIDGERFRVADGDLSRTLALNTVVEALYLP